MAKYLTLFVVVILLSLTHGAPQRQRHRRHWSSNEPAWAKTQEWVNPCKLQSIENSNPNITAMTGPHTKNKTPLKALRGFLPNSFLRLSGSDMNAINTSDVHEWFHRNATYRFLREIDANVDRIQLRQWHNDTQVYIGAFQYLASKQQRYDIRKNSGNEKSLELKGLMDLAKNLLCEIETAINNTGLRMPRVYTPEMMKKKLHFRTDEHDRHKHDEVYDLDIKFAKVRFHEYLHNLDRIMKCKRKRRIPCKHHRKHKQRNLCRKRDAEGRLVNCTLIESPTELSNNEIGHRHPLRRIHHRRRNGNGTAHFGGNGGGVRHNQIFDENGNRLPYADRRRHHIPRRHRNRLQPQFADGDAAMPVRRFQRKRIQRTFDLMPSTMTTTTTPSPTPSSSTTIPPFSS